MSVTDGQISFKFGGMYPLHQGNTCPTFQEIRSSKLEIEIWRISGKKCKKGIEYVLRLPKYPSLIGNRGH